MVNIHSVLWLYGFCDDTYIHYPPQVSLLPSSVDQKIYGDLRVLAHSFDLAFPLYWVRPWELSRRSNFPSSDLPFSKPETFVRRTTLFSKSELSTTSKFRLDPFVEIPFSADAQAWLQGAEMVSWMIVIAGVLRYE